MIRICGLWCGDKAFISTNDLAHVDLFLWSPVLTSCTLLAGGYTPTAKVDAQKCLEFSKIRIRKCKLKAGSLQKQTSAHTLSWWYVTVEEDYL